MCDKIILSFVTIPCWHLSKVLNQVFLAIIILKSFLKAIKANVDWNSLTSEKQRYFWMASLHAAIIYQGVKPSKRMCLNIGLIFEIYLKAWAGAAFIHDVRSYSSCWNKCMRSGKHIWFSRSNLRNLSNADLEYWCK